MKVIAVPNSKDGVDKTTTALTLFYVPAKRGCRTLLIGADSSKSAFIANGFERDNLRPSLEDVFFKQLPTQQCTRSAEVNNLYIVTGSLDSVAFGITISAATEREYIPHTHLNKLHGLDYISINTPLQTSALVYNALLFLDYNSIFTCDTHLAVKEIHTLLNSISWLEDDVCSKAALLSILLTNVSKYSLTNV